MKKILSLLLCLALLAALFSVSAAAEETEAEPAESAAEPFAAAVGPQAFAVTMAAWLGGYEDSSALEDPLFLWDAAGWYAAWLYRTAECDLLSPEEVEGFLLSLDGEAGALPESWVEYGVVRVLRAMDGSESYDFAQHKLEIDEMLGVNTMVSYAEDGENALTTVLSCFYENGLSADWLFSLRFEEAGEGAFPYRLTALQLLDDGPRMDEALNFTWEELMEANRLENVFALYPAVRISTRTGLEEDDGLYGTWLFERSGAFARVSYGEDYTGGEYRGCFFECEADQDGVQRARIGHIEEDGDSSGYLDSYLCDFLSGVVIAELENEEDDLIWLVCTYRGGYQERVAVDRGTLVLRELDYSPGDELPSSITSFDYMKPAPDYSFLDSWDGALRTVTAVWEEFRENEETGEWEQVVQTVFNRIPADWEYLPYEGRWGEYTIYMDPGYTKTYAYPGDGLDYTLYLTTAKG